MRSSCRTRARAQALRARAHPRGLCRYAHFKEALVRVAAANAKLEAVPVDAAARGP